eukprot:3039264-Rhodomonas_salina.1
MRVTVIVRVHRRGKEIDSDSVKLARVETRSRMKAARCKFEHSLGRRSVSSGGVEVPTKSMRELVKTFTGTHQ